MSAKPTPIDRERARIKRLMQRLPVPQHTSIRTSQPVKQKPACGVMASV